jgi:hypothetical protein
MRDSHQREYTPVCNAPELTNRVCRGHVCSDEADVSNIGADHADTPDRLALPEGTAAG